MIDVKLVNEVQLDNALKELDTKAVKKIFGQALMMGAQPIAAATSSMAASRVGGEMGMAIASHMTVVKRAGKRSRGEAARVIVGVNTSDGFGVYYPKGSTIGFVTNKRGKQKQVMLNGGRRAYRSFIPAAIEYGHASPGMGGSRMKTSNPIPYALDAARSKAAAATEIIKRQSAEMLIAEARKLTGKRV